MTEIKIGRKAPKFTIECLFGAGGKISQCTLSDFSEKNLVLYFYPKDNTFGCTKEAESFNAMLTKFRRAGADILGVSRDSITKHQKFAEKYGLRFALGADNDGKMTENYGVWIQKTLYGRKYMGIERATFLIDRTGMVRRIWHKVKVAGHAEAVLEAVKEV